ncbi:ribosome-associated translation inhibitor RaiA [Aurantimonas sp. MSK8Z-1]|uniref:ribosome hibernation-promoting factor, HPF/YfiA family n=1 Tax=Mangrovibrevibacter kandeliae TaxID=2968473 RepID=UPI002118B08C|nr:ribosome-associated translation inhibitor RaiA [Aurantimonas sp. MSK8Z-1]MCW4115148.1 ribosome-associated translation inhibitor RaiA [Aurantimonas sp. MSK8Z-1]
MSLRITGKHMDVGESLRVRIQDRLDESVAKYFDGNFSGTVVMSKDSSRFSTDCTLHLDTGVIFQATGTSQDPEASFSDAAERIEKRLRRYKRRLKDHHAGQNGQQQPEIAYAVVEAIPDEDEELPEDYAPAIIAETSLRMSTLSVAGAVMELDRRDSPVVVFRNAASGAVNIVYRRSDGNFGWVDPATCRDA